MKKKSLVVLNYDDLSSTKEREIKLVYPNGFVQHLISFEDTDGSIKKGLRLETDENILMVRMTSMTSQELIKNDKDYNTEGKLKSEVYKRYTDEFETQDYLNEYNDNNDNSFGLSTEEERDIDSDY